VSAQYTTSDLSCCSGDFYQLPPVVKQRDVRKEPTTEEQQWELAQEIAQEKEHKLLGRGYAFHAPIWDELEPIAIILRKVCRLEGHAGIGMFNNHFIPSTAFGSYCI
jgi:hypothetical protein